MLRFGNWPWRHARPTVADWTFEDDPFRTLEPSAFREANRQAEAFSHRHFHPRGSETRATAFLPHLETNEDTNAYRIFFEVPGMRKENVDVFVEDDIVRIHGHKAHDGEDGDRRHQQERRFGPFQRRIRVPADADPDAAEVTLDRGLLTIVVPKRAGVAPAQRPIRVRRNA